MKRTRIPAAVGLAVTLLASPARAAEESTTNAPAATADPSSFVRFISDRNIFDPDRRARGPGESRRQPERPRNTVIPTLTLVGVMDYSRGRFAFFDGPASEYKKTIAANGSIAGFTVAAIRPSSVILKPKEGAEIELAIGKALRLDGAEPVEAPTKADATEAADAATPPAATGDAAEVLRKLMLKRQQESK
jgi:hypothetical protein